MSYCRVGTSTHPGELWTDSAEGNTFGRGLGLSRMAPRSHRGFYTMLQLLFSWGLHGHPVRGKVSLPPRVGEKQTRRGDGTSLWSHSQMGAEPRFDPSLLGSHTPGLASTPRLIKWPPALDSYHFIFLCAGDPQVPWAASSPCCKKTGLNAFLAGSLPPSLQVAHGVGASP